ncbi:MAG: DUF1931 family protein [Deltaproteobacteria bacterium]|nr:MAG: DUF1931 family protein [Deltaproteobacteria bacterium]
MVMAVSKFEKLFRAAAGLDVDKSDLSRLEDFVNRRLHALLLMGQAAAKANGRDIIEVHDLPITPGLQESIHFFRSLDETLEAGPILERLATLPALDLGYSSALEAKLPELAGGITVSLAKVFKAIWPELKNPGSTEWETVEAVYGLLL